MVPELMEGEGAVSSQLGEDVLDRVLDVLRQEAEGRVVAAQGFCPLSSRVFTVPNLPQSLSLGPALPQASSLPELLNVQSLLKLLFIIQSSPDELDPVLKVQTLELIVAVLVILEDVGCDVAEGNDAIIQVWAVEIRHYQCCWSFDVVWLYPRLMRIEERI